MCVRVFVCFYVCECVSMCMGGGGGVGVRAVAMVWV